MGKKLHLLLTLCIEFFTLVNAKVEARLVVQALRVNTLSKLTFADSKRFDALVRDIFPGVDFKGVEYAELADALRTSAQESNLMVMETQVSITLTSALVVLTTSNFKKGLQVPSKIAETIHCHVPFHPYPSCSQEMFN